ncbi:putative bifunctional diguanylate cyclase/phosphodiesterase [Sphingomonas colocasiae]|uniref:EAL domain-containing protein n=1 Tax=Sphingomonas colocasiae TaxID=1848973 RepID=A0ABS7PXA9_9SPHN|nr:bifunctional diguanylate cyclase/phosphodiesterase [Sphingomonas colocasiae]MBY8825995.1 EAL domain-containing protein [Sphingomonas colocasiae]
MTNARSTIATLDPGRVQSVLERIEDVPAPIRAALADAGVAMAYLLRTERQLVLGDAARTLLGARNTTVSIEQALRTVDRRKRRALVGFFDEQLAGEGEQGAEMVVPIQAGSAPRRFIKMSLSADEKGDGYFVVMRDNTAQTEYIESLETERDHLRHTVELNPQLPWLADANGNIIAFTERYEKYTGRTQEELVGGGWALVVHPDDMAVTQERVIHSVMTGTVLDVRCRVRTAAGAYRWMRATAYPLRDDNGKVIRWFGYSEDIDDHVLIEQQIRWTAEHDALTRLPNRMVFNRQLERIIREENKLGLKVAILLADVDNFKDVNDVLGHDAGDSLLMAFGDLIGRVLPEKALLSRIGGDEFAIILPFDGPLSELHDVSATIFEALRDPVTVNGQSVECRVSIGASIFPFHGQSPTELFKNADIALYQAKARGRGQMTIFSLDMKQETQRRVAMINLGRKAVETDSIIPYYQMQVSLDGNRPIGFEALLRRKDRQGRICAPSSIAAAFEDAGVAEAIGDAMLRAVLKDMVRAKQQGTDLGTVSVNFSTAEFRSTTFVDRLTNRISDAGIAFSEVMIEVTEGVFLGRQVDTVSETIRTLDRLGFKIALDDFGTGYASLVHLRQLPVDTLKIDQSFIRTLAESKDDLAIVTAIINLGASLDINIIAEGIETEVQLGILRDLGLKYGQGYLFAHPVPIEEACALVAPFQSIEPGLAESLWASAGRGKRVIGLR